jgi:hypothetical protein
MSAADQLRLLNSRLYISRSDVDFFRLDPESDGLMDGWWFALLDRVGPR